MTGAAARLTPAGDSRRSYAAALLVGLLGATAVTVGTARPWYEASATVKNLPRLEASATGADLVPLAGALGVVLLASFGAVIATRRWLRRGFGLLIVTCSIVVLLAAAHPGNADQVLREGLSARGWSGGGYHTSGEPWRWLVLTGSAACLAAGAAVVRLGARWPTMGQRYDAPSSSGDSSKFGVDPPAEPHGTLTQEQLWHALDHGRDPTQRP